MVREFDPPSRKSYSAKESSDHAVPCYQLQTRAASKGRNTICFMRYYSRE